ncbi:AMP-binding protein, partial [Cyanothece sp. BG0011]|uniref:AMP-binding protein n=1 Tax=Cyanothece sp. BG0011 TaxID=2082950 RepID=UPI0013001E15
MINQTIQGFRLSPQQKYVWLQQQTVNSTFSNPFCSQIALLIQGNLQINRLQNALETLIKRYDILRTNYKQIQGIKLPVQVVNEFFYLHWQQDKTSPEFLDQTIENIFQTHREKLNNLEETTLFYLSLLTVSETKHFLLISLPALNGDAETLKNLTQEIYNIYHQKDNNDEIIDYLQFSEWQNELLEEEEATEGFNYWQQEKKHPKPSLKLPFEQQNSNSFNPKTYTLEIGREITEKIKSFATSYNVTIDNFILTCWQTLLSKLTNETHIVVNHNYKGRIYEELQDILGLVDKSIPVYSHIDQSMTLNELLIKTHETVSNHRPWQDYYLGDKNEITPIAFEFQTQEKQYQGDDITISLYQQYTCSDRFKLKLFCLLQENSLKTQFYYDASLFNLEEVQRFADYFQTLLMNIFTHPNAQIKDIEILNHNHINELLIELNNTKTKHNELTSFKEKFEQQVKQTPQNTALVYEDKKLSYEQLNQQANQLAHYLIKLGVKPDSPIPVYGDRSLEMIIAMLGIIKAGAAYLPIDSALPFAGLQQRLKEAKANILITQKSLVTPQSLPNYKVIDLDKDWPTIAQNSNQNPHIQLTPETLAYVIFTSGSTGQPKGVAIEHRQLLNYLHSIIKALDIPLHANFALVSTLAADLGHTCIFPALTTGGCLHLISQERAANAKILADYFQHHSIDCLKIVPSHLQALLAADPQGSFLPRQRLILGGEVAPWGLIDQIRQKAPNCRLFNHYGPTETTVGVTTYPIDSQTPTLGTVP